LTSLAPQIEAIIRQYGKISLLIDGSGFNGWENIAAFENHAAFVKKSPKESGTHRRHRGTRVAGLADWCGQSIRAPGSENIR
jgi:hypothetical protein